MARVIESMNAGRRIIKLSTDDILSIVQEYQRITSGLNNSKEIRDYLQNNVIFIPEDV